MNPCFELSQDAANLIIYGQTSTSPLLTLHIGRYTPTHVPTTSSLARAPRPDDPAPRPIPPLSLAPIQHSPASLTNKRKPSGSTWDEMRSEKKARESAPSSELSSSSSIGMGKGGLQRVRSVDAFGPPPPPVPLQSSKSEPVVLKREREEVGAMFELEDDLRMADEPRLPPSSAGGARKKPSVFENDNKAVRFQPPLFWMCLLSVVNVLTTEWVQVDDQTSGDAVVGRTRDPQNGSVVQGALEFCR